MQDRQAILRELQQLARESARINQRIADVTGQLLEQSEAPHTAQSDAPLASQPPLARTPGAQRTAAPPARPQPSYPTPGPARQETPPAMGTAAPTAPRPGIGPAAANSRPAMGPAIPTTPQPPMAVSPESRTGAPVWQRETTVTRLLAVAGGLITLIGLVFLAMLAYNSGILTPTNSVVLAAVACLVLFLLGLRAHTTSPLGNTPPALIVVAVLGALADLWVAVFRLQWITPTTGAVLTTALCVIGLLVAYRWQHEKLAVVVTALAPLFILPVGINVVTGRTFDVAFSACILFAALAAFAARWGRPWHTLHITAAAVYLIGTLTVWNQPLWVFLACTLGVLILMLFSYDQPSMQPLHIKSSWVAIVGGTALATLTQAPTAPLYFTVLFGSITLWTFSHLKSLRMRLEGNLHVALASAFYTSAVSLLVVLFVNLIRSQDFAFYPTAYTLLVAGLVWCAHVTDRRLTAVALALGLYVLLACAVPVLTRRSVRSLEDVLLPDALVVLTAGLFVFAGLYARPIIFARISAGWKAAIGTLCLVIASAYIPAVLLTLAPNTVTFMTAHLLISVLWISIGFILLNRKSPQLTPVALLFVGVAVAKLILFDLSVLGGTIQILAFMICGPLLLVAAFNRERWSSR